MWLGNMGQNGTKMGRDTHFSQSHFPDFRKVEDLPCTSLCQTQLTTLTDGKMGPFATHRHSPPKWLVRRLALAYQWLWLTARRPAPRLASIRPRNPCPWPRGPCEHTWKYMWLGISWRVLDHCISVRARMGRRTRTHDAAWYAYPRGYPSGRRHRAKGTVHRASSGNLWRR